MIISKLQNRALDFALREYQKGILEEEPNWSPEIQRYVRNLDPPLDQPIPWCAAFVQYCSDRAADDVGVPNPLDGVKREAYVQDYVDWAEGNHLIVVEDGILIPGDLIVYSFGGKRYDHIGFYEKNIDKRTVLTIEGNTSPIGSPDHDVESEREGDGLYRKTRRIDRHDTQFIRWA